jgi:calcium-dependent protein kinase
VRGVKILKKSQASLEEISRFLNNFNLLKKLDHQHIIKIFEMYEDNKRLYLVQELCTGSELYDHILLKKNQFSELEAAVIIRQICSALSYCHARGIIHRDIKPENIIFDSKNSIKSLKIKGFIQAKELDTTDQRKKIELDEILGTSYYIAPEVFNQNYEFLSDMWSVGVILYVMLVGKLPFDGKTDKEVIKKVRIGEIDFSNYKFLQLSEEAKNFLKQLLTYTPIRRISAMNAINHPWITLNV